MTQLDSVPGGCVAGAGLVASGGDEDGRASGDLSDRGDVAPDDRQTVRERLDERDRIALADRRQREDGGDRVEALQRGPTERAIHAYA